jgi:hypothetical protein
MLLAAALTCATGCAQPQMLSTGGEHPEIGIAPVVTDSACRTILFQMSPLSATFPSQGSCGSGLTEITPTGSIVGTMSSPRRVYFRIRIKNRSTVPVTLPLRLVLPRSGIVLLSDGSVSQVTAFNPDTLRSDSTAVWLAGGTGTLAVGDSTPVMEPIFKVDLPVNKARLNFQVLGEGLDLVPAVAPNAWPTWLSNDSNFTSTGLFRKVLTVRFIPGATVAQKTAALDSVGAVVVGGHHLQNDPDGVYVIYMSGVTSNADLLVRQQVLSRQSVVQRAYLSQRGKPSGRRPNDGTQWRKTDWDFKTDLSAGDNWAMEEVNLPVAWGCQEEASLVGVGMIELAIPGAGEFMANAKPFVASPIFPDSAKNALREHGKWVANLLAAKGERRIWWYRGVVASPDRSLRYAGKCSGHQRFHDGCSNR